MKYFFIFLFFLISIGSNCQSNFIFKYGTENDEVPSDAIEVSDGYIFMAQQGSYPFTYNTLFIKVDFTGNILSQQTISYPMNTVIFDNFIKISDSTFYCIGINTYDSSTSLNIIKMNEKLEIDWNREYNVGLQFIRVYEGLINHDNNLVVYGSGIEQDSLWDHPFIYCLGPDGDSLYYHFYRSPTSQLVSAMIEKGDSSGYIMVFSGHYQIPTYTGGQFLKFDNSFQVTSIDSIPQYLFLYNDLKLFNASHFLMSGNYRKADDSKFAIYYYDTSMIYHDKILFGPNDTINYPGYFYNLDFKDPNRIFMGGTINQNVYSVFSSNQSYFMLAQLDSQLNVTWERRYGGDMYYSLYSLRCTSDGGAILVGTSFDYLTQNNERDIYIVKVDSLGIITGINDKSISNNPIIYPNPGNNFFNLKIPEQIKKSRFVVRDIFGNIILDKNLYENWIRVDMSPLKSGIYLWSLYSENTILSEGKWIKID